MASVDSAELALPLAVLEELPMGVWVARAPGGELAYANRTFAEIMGMGARGDVASGAYASGYQLQDRAGHPYPEARLPFPRALAERTTVIVDDIVIARRDGRRVQIRASGKPLFDATGQITHVMVAFIDITAEIAATTEIAASRERLRTAVHHAPIVLFTADAAGIITLSEGAALSGMGFRSGELVGRSIYEVYRDQPDVLRNMRRVLRGDTFTTITDMGAVTLEAWLAPLRDEAGTVVGMIGVATDISDRLALQRQITQADRLAAVGRLAASVAHEINNPLAYTIEALRLAGETLAALEGGGPGRGLPAEVATRLSRLLGEAAEGADRVRLITRDLKGFSRADEDVRRALDVSRTLAVAVKLVAKRTGARSRVELELGAPVAVRGDENRLVQVFVNLIINASDALPLAAPDRNQIRITTRVDGDDVLIEVADNGPGIAPELRDRVFEPFVTTKAVGEGTGLGLFVTRNIIASMKGTITVGEAPEGGALFTVRLPIDHTALTEGATTDPPAPRAPAPAPAAPAPAPAAVRPRVVIVDDEPQIAQLMWMALQPECDVRVFTSGRAALEYLLGDESYDVVFCDLMMAGVSGMQLFDELRKRAPGRERAIAFMTGGVFDPRVSDFLGTITNDCVDKPFDIRVEVARRFPGVLAAHRKR